MMVNWKAMSVVAWSARERALLAPGGKTKVGCAALSVTSVIAGGCNIQHKYRCDIHAEVAACASLRGLTDASLAAILVVAEREKFTPCGACMDWVFELGGPNCQVGFQSTLGGEIQAYLASDLMPHYPS
jgi:cytidine deaminase